MFENSLVKDSRMRPSVLVGTLVFYVLAGASLLAAQYWHVAPVAEPPINVVFVNAAPPPPPPPPPAPAPAAPKPTAPTKPTPAPVPRQVIQPAAIPDKVPPPAPLEPAPQGDEGVPGGVPGGVPNGVPGGVPNGVPGGIPDAVPAPPPPPPPAPDVPLRVGGDVLAPACDKVSPEYPQLARVARREGTVVVQATIGLHGEIQEVKLLRGVFGPLDEAALRTVQRYRCTAGTQNGRPVRTYYTLTVNFKLNG